MSLHDALTKLAPRFGKYREGTAGGWINFERCPFDIHKKPFKFGINVRKSTYKCWSCSKSGPTKDIGIPDMRRLVTGGLAAPLAPALPPKELAGSLPWEPLRIDDDKLLPHRAFMYLKSRGISKMRAVDLGLGYGSEGRWVGYVIHPYYDDKDRLRGWQGRLQGDPDDGMPKVFTTSRRRDGDWVWGAYDGALYLHDRMHSECERAVVVEGPYDAISVARTPYCPDAAFGHTLSAAQVNRVLRKKPKAIQLAYDPGMEKDMLRDAAKFYPRFDGPIYVTKYDHTWEGDWAAFGNGKPRCAATTWQALNRFERRFVPGMIEI